MKFRLIGSAVTFVAVGWVAIASANLQKGNVPRATAVLTGVQLADNDDAKHQDKNEIWDWYQGERGHWRQDKQNGQWRWFGANQDETEHRDNDDAARRDNDEGPWDWYQGYRGHWRKERGGWHFHTPELVCNNAGRNCRSGAEIPPNGEGMVSLRNPKWFWHCDSEGHHCKWAKRPGM